MKKTVKAWVTILLGFSLSLGQAQSVYFYFTNGTQSAYNLVDVSKITFTSNVMNLHLTNGTTYSWNISTVERYEYSQFYVGVPILETPKTDVIVYPNPNQGDANIRYYLGKDTKVRIDLYSMEGKLLHTIFEGEQSKGEKNVNWNASSFTNGTYLCHITTLDYTVSKTIIIKK